MAQYTHSQVVRLTDEQAKLLEEEAARQECSKSDVIRNCISEFENVSHCDTASDTSPQALALLDQLATKDEQIAGLIRALEAAQETAKAAQALQASQGGTLMAVADDSAGELTRWERLKRAWRG